MDVPDAALPLARWAAFAGRRAGVEVDTRGWIGVPGSGWQIGATVETAGASDQVRRKKAAMKMQGRFGLATAFLLAIPSFAQAQHTAGSFRAAPSAPMGAPAAGVQVSHAGAGGGVRAHGGSGRSSTARAARATGGGAQAGAEAANRAARNHGGNHPNRVADEAGFAGDPISVQQLLNPYPGFGFDFEHLNAIHGDDDIKAFIDPATQARVAVAERLLRRSGGTGAGFVLLDGGGYYAVPPDLNGDANEDQGGDQGPQGQQTSQQAPSNGQAQGSQQPIIIIQQPAGQQPAAQPSGAEAAQEAPPLRDVGEFTLVLRSGGEIETVAFTRAGDKIVYITSEGGRRTLAVGEIDVDATVRLNQERGTPVQIPL